MFCVFGVHCLFRYQWQGPASCGWWVNTVNTCLKSPPTSCERWPRPSLVKRTLSNCRLSTWLPNSTWPIPNRWNQITLWLCVSVCDCVFWLCVLSSFLSYRRNCWLNTYWTWASTIRIMTSETVHGSFVSWLFQMRRAEPWANTLVGSWWLPNRLLFCSLPSKVGKILITHISVKIIF